MTRFFVVAFVDGKEIIREDHPFLSKQGAEIYKKSQEIRHPEFEWKVLEEEVVA